MSDKIDKVEREIQRVIAHSLDEVLGEPTAIVKRGVKSNKASRILPGKHVMYLHTIETLIDRRGYTLIVFKMTVMESDSMVQGEDAEYMCTIRPDRTNTILLMRHLRDLRLSPDVLSTAKGSSINITVDVECVLTTTKKGAIFNKISMRKRL